MKPIHFFYFRGFRSYKVMNEEKIRRVMNKRNKTTNLDSVTGIMTMLNHALSSSFENSDSFGVSLNLSLESFMFLDLGLK